MIRHGIDRVPGFAEKVEEFAKLLDDLDPEEIARLRKWARAVSHDLSENTNRRAIYRHIAGLLSKLK